MNDERLYERQIESLDCEVCGRSVAEGCERNPCLPEEEDSSADEHLWED